MAVPGKLIGTIGNPPVDVGGFVFERATAGGHRFYELEWVVRETAVMWPPELHPSPNWRIYYVHLDGRIPDWGDFAGAAQSEGMSFVTLGQWFQSPDPMVRAAAWEIWGNFHGWENVDDSWAELTKSQIEKKYGAIGGPPPPPPEPPTTIRVGMQVRIKDGAPRQRAIAQGLVGDLDDLEVLSITPPMAKLAVEVGPTNAYYEFIWPLAEIEPTQRELLGMLDDFTQQYIETALWSTNDESDPSGGVPMDQNYSIDDIAPSTLKEMIEDAFHFQQDNEHDLEIAYRHGSYDSSSAGHDFWLTREGHGAGFWDRGLGDVGDRLTEASKVYGSFYIYVGDDGKIYS